MAFLGLFYEIYNFSWVLLFFTALTSYRTWCMLYFSTWINLIIRSKDMRFFVWYGRRTS